MPADLKDWLESIASANKRSLTAEIISRLESPLARDEDVGEYKIPLPFDLVERILEESDKHQADPNELILEALEKEFPAPIPRLFGYVELIKQNLADGRYADEEQKLEAEQFVQGAELLFKEKPHLKRRILPLHTPTKPIERKSTNPFRHLEPGKAEKK